MHKLNKNSSTFDPPITHCPLCNSEEIKEIYNITQYTPKFTISRCSACSFMFMNPPLKDRIIEKLYSENYYRGTAEYSYYDERDAEKYAQHVWQARMKVIARNAPCGNFLDIGAAFGGLMRAASAHFTPYGIEMSPYSALHAQKFFGSNLHHGTLEDHPFNESFFSAITMIEVIEHMKDPVAAIKECHRLLKHKGLLVIQTANMQGYQARSLKEKYEYFMPGHLSYFTMQNLTALLRECGFSRIKVYYPVEFGLIPKLLKSRYAFKTAADYRAWLRITWYHLKSKIHLNNFAMTSSMVVYAHKFESATNK